MALQLHEIKDLETFERAFRALWTAYHHPYSPEFSIYFPVFGPMPSDTERAVQAGIQRMWRRHQGSPGSRWICVTDPAKDHVVAGACLWSFNEQDPHRDASALGQDFSAWPEGSVGLEFIQNLRKKQSEIRARWSQRKHAALQNMAVVPEYRKRGAGAMLMDWGMQRAESEGFEVFLTSSDMGQRLYEKYGLREVERISIDMKRSDASDEWEKLYHQTCPLKYTLMWKPVGAIYQDGETQLPWEINPKEVASSK